MAPRVHILSEVNEAAMTAVCRECGPVGLYRKGRGPNKPPRLQCLMKRREDRWRWDSRAKRAGGFTAKQIRQALERTPYCEICGGVDELIVDHCHESGRIRGVLCQPCNRRLGMIERKGEWLRLAFAYLNGADCPCQHCSAALARG